jgi:hypothetical protein
MMMQMFSLLKAKGGHPKASLAAEPPILGC